MKELINSMKNIKKVLLIVMISMISFSGMAQWELVMQEGGNIYSLIESENMMYAGTQFGVFKSADNGISWNEANNGLTNTIVHPMIANDLRVFAGTEAGIFISDNKGESWSESNEGLTVSKIYCLLKTEEGIYAGTDEQGLFFSSDNGDSWSVINSGITNLTIKAIVKKDDRLFIGTDGGGVFYSDDAGENWTQNNTGLSSWFINHLAVRDSKLFVGTNSNFCVSQNNGASWSALSTPFDHKVLCSVNYQEYMFVGIDGDGVFYTTDGGITWTSWSEGLENKNMYVIEIFGDYIWSPSCCGFGLFKRLLPGLTSIEKMISKKDLQIYPNPANKLIIINSELSIQSISIYNQYGHLVLALNDTENQVDVSPLNTGLYICMIKTEEGFYTQQLIIKN
ncbi:MAG: T9SS type A sorting domain-containing protein [Bacteroidales bacterium]|nr:T9SS type A sorting domain-containing protein [Bacteroidales bacterium]